MTPEVLLAVMEATWPPAAWQVCGPFRLRDGQGGGKRVSAATAEGRWSPDDISAAELAMGAMGQPPLFLIREGDEALDAALAERGYRMVDPVVAYAASAADVAGGGPGYMSTFPHWPPMAIAIGLWAEGGIGPERLAVMHRAPGPKCAILARAKDKPTGTAFVAVHGNLAMLHALEVSARHRRQGSAHNILRAAAQWALDQGCDTLCLVVTKANQPARALYASLGMSDVGHYHYRQN